MTISREMLAAGLGCCAANGALNPLETTKVKLQLQCPRNLTYHPPTMAGVIRQVAREDGIVRGLVLPGLGASLLRSMMYGSYRVGLYPSARDFFTSSPPTKQRARKEPLLIDRLISGMVTGAVGSALSCPLDVVRTRMQADSGSLRSCGVQYATGLRKGNHVRYGSTLQALWTIMREEGILHGLYRGSSVTIARATLLNGSQLASYDTLKCHVKKTGCFQEGPVLHILCSMASGVIAQTVVMPVDTIKSHFMLGKGQASWQTVMGEVYRHGPKFLYRGYVPACAAQGCCMVLQMPIIEQLRFFLGLGAI